jgi:hypothetical protein
MGATSFSNKMNFTQFILEGGNWKGLLGFVLSFTSLTITAEIIPAIISSIGGFILICAHSYGMISKNRRNGEIHEKKIYLIEQLQKSIKNLREKGEDVPQWTVDKLERLLDLD